MLKVIYDVVPMLRYCGIITATEEDLSENQQNSDMHCGNTYKSFC